MLRTLKINKSSLINGPRKQPRRLLKFSIKGIYKAIAQITVLNCQWRGLKHQLWKIIPYTELKNYIPLEIVYFLSFFSRFFIGPKLPKISEKRKMTAPSSTHKIGSGVELLSSSSSSITSGSAYNIM